jgi:glycosyltransferase involved in cell wall biosynthesis
MVLLRLRRVFDFRLAIDAHFGGVESYNGSDALQAALDSCNRSADLVIVTNPAHAQMVFNLGGRAFVCPDPLPDLSKFRDAAQEIDRKCFFICSFDIDEPYLEVFKAAESLWNDGFRLVVSGNYSKAGIAPSEYPKVRFLGYVPTSDFYRELFSAQVAIDLTEHENCLLCGAYEAMAAGKPLVLSKKRSLQEYFDRGTVFGSNEAGDIALAIRHAYTHRSQLASDAEEWATKARADMSTRIAELRDRLQEL